MLTPIVIVVAFCSLISAALFFLGDDGAGTLTLFIGAAVIGVILFSDISNSGVSEKQMAVLMLLHQVHQIAFLVLFL